jgi:hypothetical protein
MFDIMPYNLVIAIYAVQKKISNSYLFNKETRKYFLQFGGFVVGLIRKNRISFFSKIILINLPLDKVKIRIL